MEQPEAESPPNDLPVPPIELTIQQTLENLDTSIVQVMTSSRDLKVPVAKKGAPPLMDEFGNIIKRPRGRPRKYPLFPKQDTPTLTIQDHSGPSSPSRPITVGFRATSPDKRKKGKLLKGDLFDPRAGIALGSFVLANGKHYNPERMAAYIPAMLEDRSRHVGDVLPVKRNDNTLLVSLASNPEPVVPVWTEEGFVDQDKDAPVAGFVKLDRDKPVESLQTSQASHNTFDPKPLIPLPTISLNSREREHADRLAALAQTYSGPTNLALASSLSLFSDGGKAKLVRGGYPEYDFPVHYRPLRHGYKPEETVFIPDPAFELTIEAARRAKWSKEEIERFEMGLEMYGKEFYKIWQVIQGQRSANRAEAWQDLRSMSERVYQEEALTSYRNRFGMNVPWFTQDLLTLPYLGIAGALSPIPTRPRTSNKTVSDCVQFFYLSKYTLAWHTKRAYMKKVTKEFDQYREEANASLTGIRNLLVNAKLEQTRQEIEARESQNAVIEKLK